MNKYSKLVRAHDRALVRKFGKLRADRCNFCWSVDGDKSVCSKVYPVKNGQVVEYLTTYLVRGRYIHESA